MQVNVIIYQRSEITHTHRVWFGSVVVRASERRTCDQQVVSSTPGRALLC